MLLWIIIQILLYGSCECVCMCIFSWNNIVISSFCIAACSSWWSRCTPVMHQPCGARQTRAASQLIRESWPWTSWLRLRMLLTSQISTASSLYVRWHMQFAQIQQYSNWTFMYLCLLVNVEDPPGATALPGSKSKLYRLHPHSYTG